MRNETVERIVNLLFQDVEMTDEVQALYDETMSNCQERYQDMTSRGLSDDDAIAAVVESLKGMEDVVSQYPKKSEAPEAEEAPKSADVPVDDDGDGEQTDFTFHPADIGRIEMTMVCDACIWRNRRTETYMSALRMWKARRRPSAALRTAFCASAATPMPRSATEAASLSAAVSPTGGCM